VTNRILDAISFCQFQFWFPYDAVVFVILNPYAIRIFRQMSSIWQLTDKRIISDWISWIFG
jgi:hypothetical protein